MPKNCICNMVGPGLEIRQDWKFARIGNSPGLGMRLDQDCDRDVKCTSFAKQQQAFDAVLCAVCPIQADIQHWYLAVLVFVKAIHCCENCDFGGFFRFGMLSGLQYRRIANSAEVAPGHLLPMQILQNARCKIVAVH